MRVIAGKYKGMRLAPVKGANIRYTADAVKESLFSILRDDILDSHFLDIYAGSGNVGIEALSRGAESVAYVEVNPVCAKTISANLSKLGLSPEPPGIILLNMSISRGLEYLRRHKMRFHIIFLDPPYQVNLLRKSLKEIFHAGILSADGELIAEHDVRENAPDQIDDFIMARQKVYGTTALSFYKYEL